MASGEAGGGAGHLLALLPELRALGVECEAAVGSRGPLARELAARGFKVHALELMRARLDALAGLRLARLVRAVAPDAVHWHGTRAAWFGALARPLLRPAPPALYTVHGLSYRKTMGAPGRALYRLVERIACRASDRVLSVSAADLADLEHRGMLEPGRGTHTPNAVDLERFRPGDRAAARRRFGLPPDDVVVGTVSRLVPGKSVADLVAAAGRLGGMTFAIAGEGPERPALEVAARASGARVRFLGERDDVPEFLRALDLFVLCSRWEGEPIALIEALATGLACVATATSGARELLEGGEGGVLVPAGDPGALAAAIEKLAGDPAARARLGGTARARVVGRTPRALAESVLRAYRSLGLMPGPAGTPRSGQAGEPASSLR
jgi:glycosyltransferase involved in cell wall biosynthesis